MGLLKFLNKRKLRKGIENAEWRVGTVEMGGLPEALADLGKAHAEAGDFPNASKYFLKASGEARKFERTRSLAPRFKSIAQDYKNRTPA